MKKIVLTLWATLFYISINAQIATWLIPPRFNHVQLVPGTNIYKGGVNDSTYLWNINGERLLGTKYYVGPFVDNVAVVADGKILKGLVNTKGKYYSFNNITPSYEIDTKFPQFSDGYLLVKKENFYYFLDKEGKEVLGPYGEAYPFHAGTTSVLSYENPQKLKGELHSLVRNNLLEVNFTINNKLVNFNDISFCSVLNDQKKAIVIVKKDVYLFDDATNSISRISCDGSDNKKSLLSLPQSEIIKTPLEEGGFSIVLNKGTLYFDKYCILTKIEYDGTLTPTIYEKNKPIEQTVSKQLAICSSKDGTIYGIDWVKGSNDRINILPPQFSDVADIIATNAVVCLKDKYGVVTLDQKSSFKFTLNNGNDIGFAHGKYPSNIQVSLPNFISWQNTIMSATKDDRCEILPVSRTGADTREGNYLKYDCNLFIPEGLTENRIEKDYHFSLNYDGLQSPSYAVKAKTWYIQQYEVNIEKQGVKSDSVWAQVYIGKKTDVESANGFWFNVDVSSKDIHVSKTIKKIDENTYLIKVFDIPEGSFEVSIDVNEDNCPPIRFPYTLNYNGTGKKNGNYPIFVKKE